MNDVTSEFDEEIEEKVESEVSLTYFRACRFSYRIGQPLIEDFEYDILKEEIEKRYPDAEELYQVYELDKIIPDELVYYDIDINIINLYSQMRNITKEFKYEDSYALLDEDNKSILSIKSQGELNNQFRLLGSGKYILSPKIDGLFTSVIYERYEDNIFKLTAGFSRGGSTDSVEVTNTISNVVPQMLRLDLPLETKAIRVSGESIFDRNYLDLTDYKSQRSACMGVIMATVNMKTDYFKYIKFLVHGLSFGEDYVTGLNSLEECSFSSVPTFILDYDTDDLEGSLYRYGIIQDKIDTWAENNKITIDGIVILKESFTDDKSVVKSNKLYNKNVFADKIKYWHEGYYQSTVIGIECKQKNCDMSIKLIVEPVQAISNSNTLTRVTNLRLDSLINLDIKIGTRIEFEYINETTIKFVRRL